jgi:hypothetical protein
MKQSDLVGEIEDIIQRECLGPRRPILKSWLRQAIITRHPRIYGDDADFAILCVAEHVEDTVEQVARRYKPKADRQQQTEMVFEGYEYVQKAYMIDRDGDSTLVPTGLATPEELRAKAKDLRQMGAGCYAHADELDRLADERERERED